MTKIHVLELIVSFTYYKLGMSIRLIELERTKKPGLDPDILKSEPVFEFCFLL